jgi:hypothetical protein
VTAQVTLKPADVSDVAALLAAVPHGIMFCVLKDTWGVAAVAFQHGKGEGVEAGCS